MHVEGIVRSLRDGLDTQLGEQWEGVGRSDGHWQSLALARIALHGAPVLRVENLPPSADTGNIVERVTYPELLGAGEKVTEILADKMTRTDEWGQEAARSDGHR